MRGSERITTDDIMTGAIVASHLSPNAVTHAALDASVATSASVTAAAAAAPAAAVAQGAFASIAGLGGVPVWVKYSITAAAIQTLGASLTGTLSPAGLVIPAGTFIAGAALVCGTAFTGTSLTALHVTVGDAESATDIFASQSLFATGKFGASLALPYTAADQVKLAFTSVGANLNVANLAGSATLYLLCLALD